MVHLVKRVFALLFGLLIPATGLAKEPRVHRPESVGMSSERLERIGPVLNGYINRNEVPGFVTLIARHGRIVHHEAHGRRVIEEDEPMPRDAIFDLASMTKPITAIAAMMLNERAALRVTDPLHRFDPSFKDIQVKTDEGLVPAERPITIHHLLTHTSGIDETWSRNEVVTFGTLAKQMSETAKLPLRAHPGDAFIYGDSFNALSWVVEVASGKRFDRFLQDELFGPLGMNDTHFWLPEEKESRRAMVTRNGKSDLESRYSKAAAAQGTYFRGASGLHGTALDYWRFCQMLLNGGEFEGRRYLSPKTIEWLASNHLGSARWYFPGAAAVEAGTLGFGFGFMVSLSRDGASDPREPGSYWWGGSQGTTFWIDPETNLVAILLVQTVPHNHLSFHEDFAALTYAAVIE
jgi:CubicO group peptidase (beta-lactamase class C family)